MAGKAGSPWLIGGVIPAAPPAPGVFRPFTYPTVAIWAAPSPNGPWHLASMRADPERDGPFETITFLATGREPAVAFGWRNSPTEAYPRPSVWDAVDRADDAWQEVIEDREFFGGPDIVGFGGAASGPHGYFIAGTWTSPSGSLVGCVWSSLGGTAWTRDSTDASFAFPAGQVPIVNGIADGPTGILVAGTADTPTAGDPGAEQGVMWYSPDGRRWSRLDAGQVSQLIPRSGFGAVAATAGGWIVGGVSRAGGTSRPLAWFVPAGRPAGRPVLLERTGAGPVTVTSVAADSSRAVVAAVSGDHVEMWTAPLHDGIPGEWSAMDPPPSSPASLQKITVSISSTMIAADLVGKAGTQVWTAPLPGTS